MTDQPLDHVLRPTLPWRHDEAPITECGLRADSYPTITRDELFTRARKLGRQRTYLITCVTCLSTAQRWPTWDQDPVAALGREIQRRDTDQFRDELLAIAALIDAHRDEFDETVDGLGSVARLDHRRTARRQ